MAGYKKTPNAKAIINITIRESLLKKIEDYQYEERCTSRSHAFFSFQE